MFPKNEGAADRTIRVVAGLPPIAVGVLLLGGLEASVVVSWWPPSASGSW